MKSFVTSTSAPLPEGQEEQVGSPVTVDLDGRQITFRAPESKTFLMLMSIYAELDSGNQMLALGSAVNLMFNLLEGEDRNYMKRRLFSPKDPLNEEVVLDLFRHLIEEWSARPTESPSVSASTPSTDGQSLTGTASPTASIPASFGQTGS